MGFFSWDCKWCGHSIIHTGVARGRRAWLSEGVFLFSTGCVLVGDYDGYGRLFNGCVSLDPFVEIDEGDPCAYHKRCWEKAGKPVYSSPSGSADDQGHFFDEAVIDAFAAQGPPDEPYGGPPRTSEKIQAIREALLKEYDLAQMAPEEGGEPR